MDSSVRLDLAPGMEMVNHLTGPIPLFGCTRALHILNIASAASWDNLVLAGSPSDGAAKSARRVRL